jgi:hypothetical protein
MCPAICSGSVALTAAASAPPATAGTGRPRFGDRRQHRNRCADLADVFVLKPGGDGPDVAEDDTPSAHQDFAFFLERVEGRNICVEDLGDRAEE